MHDTGDCDQNFHTDETLPSPGTPLCEYKNVENNQACKTHCRKHPDCTFAIYDQTAVSEHLFTCTLYAGKVKKSKLVDKEDVTVVKLTDCTNP